MFSDPHCSPFFHYGIRLSIRIEGNLSQEKNVFFIAFLTNSVSYLYFSAYKPVDLENGEKERSNESKASGNIAALVAFASDRM